MDLRFLRTETLIRDKFLQELETKDFQDITVTQLAKDSMIDRTTFYTHYPNTYELAVTLIDEQINYFKNVLAAGQRQRRQQPQDFDGYYFFSKELVAYLLDNAKMLKILRNIPLGKMSFDVQLREVFKNIYLSLFHYSESDFITYLIVNLAIGNVDFIINESRVPRRAELIEGLQLMNQIINH